MHIRKSILTLDLHPKSFTALLACIVLTAANGCNVYDRSLLDLEHVEREQPVQSAIDAGRLADAGMSETACAGHSCQPTRLDASMRSDDCDAGADDCAPAARSHHRPGDPLDPGDHDPVDAVDECPNDPNKQSPGTCGCDQPDTDSDHDGTADCEDGCPHDQLKTAAGSCGCDVSDADTDADGTPDCLDACPYDAGKTSIGMCGCGVADADADADGTADCIDECPHDPSKTAAGLCGCGQAEPPNLSEGELGCNQTALLHRYSFDESGSVVRDRAGDAPATITSGCGSAQKGGAVALSGSKDCYVTLPRSAWPNTASATFESWITWNGDTGDGNSQYERVFDFGNQSAGLGQTYLYLSPSGEHGVRTEFSVSGSDGQVHVDTTQPLAQNVMKQLAVVVDGDSSTLTLYVDGVRQGWVKLPTSLNKIQPTNLWLGRSNYNYDPPFFGSLHEFRIYGTALTPAQIQMSSQAGPDVGLSP